MDENQVGQTPPPPTESAREYIIPEERKRPALVYVIAIVMIVLCVFMVLDFLVIIPFSKKMMDSPQFKAQMSQWSDAQRERYDKGMEQMAKLEKRSWFVPVLIVMTLLELVAAIGLLLFKEWGRIGMIVLLCIGLVWGLLDFFVLNWMTDPGSYWSLISPVIQFAVIYYLTTVAWAFKPKVAEQAA